MDLIKKSDLMEMLTKELNQVPHGKRVIECAKKLRTVDSVKIYRAGYEQGRFDEAVGYEKDHKILRQVWDSFRRHKG